MIIVLKTQFPLVGAFSVITNLRMELFEALLNTRAAVPDTSTNLSWAEAGRKDSFSNEPIMQGPSVQHRPWRLKYRGRHLWADHNRNI